ncbi:50S ribosomal protein L14 [Candidatus Jorgensenbacteria bacterium GWA1_54_12]|uniref:Large ribosomal subunit protein uL14 n=1 Tax=Candidatus Jorgensenbacteria bacterium GWA1_54_12 TaxID=1798468 RepID=A0A1F6BM82_9BACT|nr:MAG: 50S ribosomal protein L14 [Candidatus Jorgensenbacteria bacterium GWA1_54_12]
MIQERAILDVADNTGAKKVRCFRILGGTRRRYARIGDVIVASVRDVEPRKLVKKKDVVHAVVVRQRQAYRREDGSYIRFDDNAVVLIEKREPRGTRIFGPIPRELRDKGFQSIVSMSGDVV